MRSGWESWGVLIVVVVVAGLCATLGTAGSIRNTAQVTANTIYVPGTYPSIAGTHTGTITPSHNLTVSQLYTYPCPGTGGHTESLVLYDDGALLATGTWNGYVGDWHNVTITPPVTLQQGHVYRYVITTGSYPQMHHRATVQTDAGWINCTAFTDANGRLQDAWVPLRFA